MRLFAVPRRALFTCMVLGAMFLVAINGCSDDDDDDNPVNPGGGSSTQLTGAFVGATDGGKISITIPLASTALAPRLGGSPAAVTATGVLSPVSGGTINLAGAYDPETNILGLTGGTPGSEYTFDGQYEVGTISGITGDFVGPNGSGGFATAVGGSGTVFTYCGTYTNASDETGNLNLLIVGTTVAGGVVTNLTLYGFEGTVTGTAPNQTITVNDEVEPGIVVNATASLNATTGVISGGTYTITVEGTETDSGTWQGSTACSTPPTK